jgi:hypothetical protein
LQTFINKVLNPYPAKVWLKRFPKFAIWQKDYLLAVDGTSGISVKAPIDQAFHYIAPIYLPHIFPGAGPIAGISGTSINEGWNKAGLSRTIYFNNNQHHLKDRNENSKKVIKYSSEVVIMIADKRRTSIFIKYQR